MKLRLSSQARFTCWHPRVLAAVLVLTANAGARAQQSTQDLAAAAQNPVAAMYSLPFQNNIYGGVGPQHGNAAAVEASGILREILAFGVPFRMVGRWIVPVH